MEVLAVAAAAKGRKGNTPWVLLPTASFLRPTQD